MKQPTDVQALRAMAEGAVDLAQTMLIRMRCVEACLSRDKLIDINEVNNMVARVDAEFEQFKVAMRDGPQALLAFAETSENYRDIAISLATKLLKQQEDQS